MSIENQPSQSDVIVIDDYTVSKRKENIIIFGRSPFINQLKLNNIDYTKFDVLCINYPIPDIKVHYVVSADNWVKPKLAPATKWISSRAGWIIRKQREVIRRYKELNWLHYSSDLAVNFAILQGYKNIYLAGVDLVEDSKPFDHYDGVVNKNGKDPNGIKEEKEYIKELCLKANVNIYQTNPQADWLEYKNINLL